MEADINSYGSRSSKRNISDAGFSNILVSNMDFEIADMSSKEKRYLKNVYEPRRRNHMNRRLVHGCNGREQGKYSGLMFNKRSSVGQI